MILNLLMPTTILALYLFGITNSCYAITQATTSIDLYSLTPAQGVCILGPSLSLSGYSVSGAGDVNKDGYADLIIGDYNAGYSYLVYGGKSLPSNVTLSNVNAGAWVTISGPPLSWSGSSVSGAGDVNEDGYDDLIIGGENSSKAYLVYGGKSLPSTIPLSTLGIQGVTLSGIASGCSVSGAGDVNGDGYADLIIGDYNANDLSGYSYLVYGSASLPSTITLSNLGAWVTISGPSLSGSGYLVSGAGDVNGDGYDDMLIGAPGLAYSYLVYGSPSLPNNITLSNLKTQGVTLYGIETLSSVSGAGDVNGDGYDDLIIGDPEANDTSGYSYLVYGSPSLPSSIDLSTLATLGMHGVILSGPSFSESGTSVSGAGDVNGDSYSDMLIGAPGLGYSYLVYGSPSLTSPIDLSNLGMQGVILSGTSSSSIGTSVVVLEM